LIPYGNWPLLIGHGWLFHPILEYATNPVEHAGPTPTLVAAWSIPTKITTVVVIYAQHRIDLIA
jgi:hypothetical protein